jgi:hypothetical protein
MRETTPYVLAGLPLILALVDFAMYRLSGNDATFSKVLLDVRLKHPIVALSTCYSFGMLLTHCFIPKIGEPPPDYVVVARMIVFLSPTFSAIVLIAFTGRDTLEQQRKSLEAAGQLGFAGLMLIALIAGGAAGHFGLAQHLEPARPEGV